LKVNLFITSTCHKDHVNDKFTLFLDFKDVNEFVIVAEYWLC